MSAGVFPTPVGMNLTRSLQIGEQLFVFPTPVGMNRAWYVTVFTLLMCSPHPWG